jgi:hypothetical protein
MKRKPKLKIKANDLAKDTSIKYISYFKYFDAAREL